MMHYKTDRTLGHREYWREIWRLVREDEAKERGEINGEHVASIPSHPQKFVEKDTNSLDTFDDLIHN